MLRKGGLCPGIGCLVTVIQCPLTAWNNYQYFCLQFADESLSGHDVRLGNETASCFVVKTNRSGFALFLSIDHLTIPSRCGKGVLHRISEVFDCWFESGSMPYAQVHYPFENKREFDDAFPADFIAEGIDQTRGWYVLCSFKNFTDFI